MSNRIQKVLASYLPTIFCRLVAARVPFSYEPLAGHSWAQISVPAKHAPTLARIVEQLRPTPL